VRALLPTQREETGSVEGTLETISVHKAKTFVIYDSITRKGVTCHISDDALLSKATAALGKKVFVGGRVSFNVKNEPVKIVVRMLRIIGENKTLPTARELLGSNPNMTGDLSTDEYIESIRRGDKPI
jgi:hypothetical protein